MIFARLADITDRFWASWCLLIGLSRYYPSAEKLEFTAINGETFYTYVGITRSPFDGDWAYWAGRWGYYPGIHSRLALLLRLQRGRCAHCKLSFLPEAIIEVHHKDGDHSNDKVTNLQALHGHCHDAVHREVTISADASVYDKDCFLEEPCEVESLMHGSEGQPSE